MYHYNQATYRYHMLELVGLLDKESYKPQWDLTNTALDIATKQVFHSISPVASIPIGLTPSDTYKALSYLYDCYLYAIDGIYVFYVNQALKYTRASAATATGRATVPGTWWAA